jgi:hypothetical protein
VALASGWSQSRFFTGLPLLLLAHREADSRAPRIKKALRKSKKARKKAKVAVKVKVSGDDGSGTTKKKIKLKP